MTSNLQTGRLLGLVQKHLPQYRGWPIACLNSGPVFCEHFRDIAWKSMALLKARAKCLFLSRCRAPAARLAIRVGEACRPYHGSALSRSRPPPAATCGSGARPGMPLLQLRTRWLGCSSLMTAEAAHTLLLPLYILNLSRLSSCRSGR